MPAGQIAQLSNQLPLKEICLNAGCAGLEAHKSRQGRLTPCETGQPSFQDLSCCGHWFPTLKTLGYSRMSLRDKDRMSVRDKGLDRFLGASLGSNPSGIGHSCPLRS